LIRLIDRNDTSLAVALVAGALVMFQRPLRTAIDLAHDLDVRYKVDLVPGLTVLVGAYAFHQYRKRQQARAAVAAAQAEAALERARAEDLERLVAFGRALGGALESGAIRQVFWRHLPTFARDREVWMLTRDADGWDRSASELGQLTGPAADRIETVAVEALDVMSAYASMPYGVAIQEYRCFPMMVGDTAVGVVGVREVPALSAAEQSAMGAAVALLAIAVRNEQLLAQTRDSSVRDGLTGCFNRAYAIETLSKELRRASRTGHPVAVLMIDIDEFKAVNDRFGHLSGDALLTAVGARLATVLRTSDVKCRYGGDEFLVILPDTPIGGAEHVAAAVTHAVADLVLPESDEVSPTVSLGVAAALPGEQDAHAVIARADEALYRAKREGRNRFAAAPLAHAG